MLQVQYFTSFFRKFKYNLLVKKKVIIRLLECWPTNNTLNIYFFENRKLRQDSIWPGFCFIFLLFQNMSALAAKIM